MIQINPLQSYINGGARAAITTPPSASLVFDLPGRAIWVKGVKLKGTDHTYTFSHDNYITLTNTPGSDESEDIKIGVNITLLKQAIDTTYTTGTLEQLQLGVNTTAQVWTAKILSQYVTGVLPITKTMKINGTDYAIFTTENSLPTFFAPGTLGNAGQILASTASGLTWVNQTVNTDFQVTLGVITANNDYRIILKKSANDNAETSSVNFASTLLYNPSTKILKINGNLVVTFANTYIGATSSANATAGLVPAATSAQRTYYLRGDGTWQNVIQENTWRPIKVAGTERLGSGTDTGAVDFVAGTGITLGWDATNKRITITNSAPDQNHNTDRTSIKLGTVSGTKKTDSTLISASSSTGLVVLGGTNLIKVGDGTNYIEVPITIAHGLSTKNMNVNGTNYAIYTSASSLPTFIAPTGFGSANQILATNANGNGFVWVAKPVSNVTTTAVVASSATGTSQITAAQNNPYYNLLEGGAVSRSIRFVAGAGITISAATDGQITITNASPDQNHNTDRTSIKLASVSGTKKTDSTLIIANSSTGLSIAGGTNLIKIGDGTNYIEVPITINHGLSTKNMTINGTAYALYTSASSLPTIIAPSSFGTANYILATNSSGNGFTWVAKPTSNVTTTAIVGNSATATSQITAALANPYYNLLEGGSVTRSIRFVAGTGITISAATDGLITITNSAPDVNHNTHFVTSLYIGENNDTKANAAVGNPYLKLFDDNTRRSTLRFVAGNGITIGSDANGNITITNSKPDVNHNVTTTAIVGASASATTQITAAQANPYYNLLEGGAVTRSIRFVAGNGITISAATDGLITITNSKPDVNHDTHYVTSMYIGENNDTKANVVAANPYLKLFDNDTRRSTLRFVAGNGITIGSDANGNITITNSKPDVNHNTDRTGVKLGTVSGTQKTDSTLIIANSTAGLVFQGGTNLFKIGDGTNYIQVPITPSFTVSNKAATIGTSLTTIATINGTDITAKILPYVRYYNNHDNNIDTLNSEPYIQTAASAGGAWTGTKPSNSHNGVALFNFQTHSGNYYTQLALDTNQNFVWIRSANNSATYGSWARLAMASEIPTVNNASLTLQTADTTLTVFYANDSTNRTFNVTCANIGAATSGHNHNGTYVPILSTLSGAGTADSATDLWGVRSCYDTNNGGIMALLNLNYNSANIIQLRFIVDGVKNLTHVYARGWHEQNGWQASKEFAFMSDLPTKASWNYDDVYSKLGHTHPLSIAVDSGTSSIALAASTKYKLTAGGSTYVFTSTPDENVKLVDNNNNENVPILLKNGTGTGTITSSVRTVDGVTINPSSNSINIGGVTTIGGNNSNMGIIKSNDPWHGIALRTEVAGYGNTWGTDITFSAKDSIDFWEYSGLFRFRRITLTTNTIVCLISTSGISGNGFHHSAHDNNDSVLLAGGSYKAVSDFATSTHNHDDRYVTALGTNGNYVTWTKNGTANNLTVPYATNATYSKYPIMNWLDGTDMNTVKTPGFYAGYTMTNSGYGSISTFLILNYSNDWGTLIQFGADGRIYHRRWTGSGGVMDSTWNTIAYLSDIPTKASWNYDDVYVKKVGDIMTGPLKINATPSHSDPPLQICYTADYTATEYTIGLLKFGAPTYDSYLGIAPTTKTCFGKVGYFYHIGSGYEFDWMTSGWTKLMALECSTGNLWIKGNVGIGTTNPSYKLHIVGQAFASNGIKVGGSGLQYPIRITRAYNDSVDFLIGSAAASGISTLDFRLSNNTSGGGNEVYIDLIHGGGGVNISPSLTIAGNTAWHAGNDGSGSGLDADLLDGKHASDFALSAHIHNMNDIKWPGGHNLITSATANGQEWSIDCTPGTYTGTYWLVWRATTSGISVSGTMLKVDCDTGKVSAPYGFVGNLSGTATSADNADTLDNIHANGLLTDFSNYHSGTTHQLSITVGGTTKRTTPEFLAPYSTLTYGNSGLQYFNINGTAGTTANANVTPSSAWYHILRMNHANSTGHFVDIAVPLNDIAGVWWRLVRGGTNYGWFKILDSNNYTSYVNPRAVSKSMWGGTYIDASGNFQSFAGNFNMSTGDLLNMTGADWDGFAFNYASGKSGGQSTRFYNGATREIVRFLANGNVGIGTTSPSTKLHISGGKILINPPAEVWTTVLDGYCSSLSAGQAVAITIGKTNSQYDACALQYYHVGDGSSSNYMALSMYDNNRLLTVNAAGNVGIGTGTTAPSYKLHVEGTGYYSSSLRVNGPLNVYAASGRSNINMVSQTDQPNDLYFGSNGASHWSWTSRESTDPWIGLYRVRDSTWAIQILYNSNSITFGYNTYAPHYYESSDIRLKHDISMLSKSIRKFRFNDDNKLYYGFIALELEVEHPELVDSSGEYKTVNYNSAICYYIAELENRVKELEDKLKKYENMLIKKD